MWHYAADDIPHGPIELEQLKTLISQGTITASTLVWTPGMEQWSPAAETPLRELLPPASAATLHSGGQRSRTAGQAIQPMQLLKETFRRAGSLYMPMLAFFVPTLLISIGSGISMAERPTGSLSILLLLGYGCIGPFTTGASIDYVQKKLTGLAATLVDSVQKAAHRFSQLVLATILLWVVLVPAFLLLVIPGIYLSMRLQFVYHAVIIEHRSAADALARSMQLTRGRWWQVFWAALLIGLLVGLCSVAAMALFRGAPVVNAQIASGVIGLLGAPIVSIYYVILFMTLVRLNGDSSMQADPS